MSDINRVIIKGRLTRDPDLKEFGDGRNIARFSIANSEYWKGAENDQYVNYFNCVAWGKKAKTISLYFKKGTPILIEGKMRNERWNDSEGKPRQSVVINVEQIDFIGSRKEGDQSSGQSSAGEENQDHTPHIPSGNSGGFDEYPMDDDIPF